MTLRIAAVQAAPTIGAVADNIAAAASWTRRAGADLDPSVVAAVREDQRMWADRRGDLGPRVTAPVDWPTGAVT